MKNLLVFLIITLSINVKSQKMKNYCIDVKINASKERVWKVITDFDNYAKWNSVLEMKNNDSLILGNKFQVTMTQPNGKQSKFKAKVVSYKKLKSFAATQKIVGKWFFSATHHFIIKEIDEEHTTFIQKWELKGIVSSMFRKQIYNELTIFNTMNNELKEFVEK